VNGLPAAAVAFQATNQAGVTILGEALFIAHGEEVFQLIGLTVPQAPAAVRSAVSQALRSFAVTTTGQQFQRVRELDIITLTANTPLATLASRSGGAIDAAQLAIINGVEAGSSIPAGRKIKTVRYR
jgi:predicted Zn-dependent protease